MAEDCSLSQKKQAAAPMQQILQSLAIANSPKFGPYFQRMREAFPKELARVCVRHIATHEAGPAERRMVAWLTIDDAYLSLVIGSDLLSNEEAQHAVKILQSVDPKFFVRLSQFICDAESSVLTRALNLLEVAGDYTALVPRLNALTSHADERIRSKAVKALCGLRPNKALLKRQLQAADSRVRANAVEAIWHMQGPEAEEIFREALSDHDHRVVVNALLGLHFQNNAHPFERLLELAKHGSPGFRAAAAWAFGRIGDRRAVPALNVLITDASEMVQKRALQVLAQFPPEVAEEPILLIEEVTGNAAEPACEERPAGETQNDGVPLKPEEPAKKDVPLEDFAAPSFRLF